MKKILLILASIIIFVLFVVNHKEGFDLNIRIGFEKPLPRKPPQRRGVPNEYNYPKGVKNTNPNYKPMLNPINTQMLRARNDDDYGGSADTGIERGS